MYPKKYKTKSKKANKSANTIQKRLANLRPIFQLNPFLTTFLLNIGASNAIWIKQ